MPGYYKKKKKDELKIAAGPALPKETSGGGYKGSGKPTKPKDVKLPGEKLAKKNTHKKGDPERYIIAITFNIDFLKDKKLISNKIFEKNYEYKNMSSKYNLKIYEQGVKSNLVNNIYEEIIKYLNFIE